MQPLTLSTATISTGRKDQKVGGNPYLRHYWHHNNLTPNPKFKDSWQRYYRSLRAIGLSPAVYLKNQRKDTDRSI